MYIIKIVGRNEYFIEFTWIGGDLKPYFDEFSEDSFLLRVFNTREHAEIVADELLENHSIETVVLSLSTVNNSL